MTAEGDKRLSPSLLPKMNTQDPVIEKIEAMLLPLLEGSDMFVTDIRIKPTNNVKVFLDADSGLNVGMSATVNRKLYQLLEESGLFPADDFSLEVSSPGVDEPLNQHRQYVKNIGRTLLVEPSEGNPVTGILKEVTEDKIVIEEKIPKKKETKMVDIPFSFIKKATVQIVF